MDLVYRKAKLSDSKRIAELFKEMLTTIYHVKNVEGYEDGYPDRFFSEGDDPSNRARPNPLRPGARSVQLSRDYPRLLMTSFSYCFTTPIQASPTGTFCLQQ